MELDDVIDQMIAEQVIHRHRRKWIALFVALVLAIALIWVLNGWKEPETRTVPTVQAPYSEEFGRFAFDIESARIVQTKKGKYTEASAAVYVKLGVRNIDTETKKTESVSGDLLRLVPKKGKLIQSNGVTCRGQLNYKLVYGLDTESCEAKFEVPPGYSETLVEIGVFGEEFRSDTGISVSDTPYWHDGKAAVVVQLTAEVADK